MDGNKCLWCGLPSIDRYCRPHLALGEALDRLDEQIRHWSGENVSLFEAMLAARDILYRELSLIEPEVGDEEG